MIAVGDAIEFIDDDRRKAPCRQIEQLLNQTFANAKFRRSDLRKRHETDIQPGV